MVRILVLVFFLTHSQAAFSWGSAGQTITVVIAEKYLSTTARMKIRRILGEVTLSRLATWADQARNSEEWRQTGPWHYIDMVSGNYLNEPANIRDAISYCQSQLDSAIPDKEKVVWLKFLIHFIGDLHQPMHIGDPLDRGGNQTRVSYLGKKVSLHGLWDSSFIREQGLTISAFVEKLLNQSRSQSALRETFNTDIVIEENYNMRKFLYSFKGREIDKTYARKASDLTDERLWTGGLRLAALLNEIFR
jgi:hypothetical protein